MGFKDGFVWGAATASYQVEGAVTEGGRGLTVWDEFARIPGKTFSGHTGDVAADHYHRYVEDVAIMKALGLKAYRFSVAWSRILPQGYGAVNEEGLRFYKNLVDELVENGIEPYVTLFHWDLPYGLYRIGGWQNPAITDYFAEYARIVAEYLGDKVKHYITFNEPQCFIGLGHVTGEHAPGNIMSRRAVLEMAHHVLLAHGKATKVLRKVAPHAKIGYAPTCSAHYPDTQKPEVVFGNRKFRCGDKVMQIRNNYQMEWEIRGRYGVVIEKGVGVFNGDTGILREINEFAETAEVEFEDGRFAMYSFKQLEELELAYAITIHKSQGSEYPAVILPLLSGPQMLLNRNLLYTAVTRARKCVTVVGNEETFVEMIRNEKQQKRYSALDERIRELSETTGDNNTDGEE